MKTILHTCESTSILKRILTSFHTEYILQMTLQGIKINKVQNLEIENGSVIDMAKWQK